MVRWIVWFIACIFIYQVSAFHTFDLRNGGVIKGEVLLERDKIYYVDIGFDVIEVPSDSILNISESEVSESNEESGEVFEDNRLYRVLPEGRDLPIREWVGTLGEAVTLIQTPTGLGSGFVIHPDGYVVTNDHVIAGEHKLSVTVFRQGARELSKVTYENVRIVSTSSDLDLALLKIEDTDGETFKTVPIASGIQDVLKEGQTVFAIGSPLGLDRTVSEGIISVAKRVIGGKLYLQTTTQINPGNSGGPLFNLEGEVVGVNNMKIAAVGAEGLGFSISASVLKTFLDNRDAYAFDPRNPNAGFRYLSPPVRVDLNLDEKK